MAVQVTWMRKHMLQSPGPDRSQHERKMSETEMRALRSTEKMSKPDWYINKSSLPPKIISNNTPIDQRPSLWKNLPVKKSFLTVATIVLMENSTESGNDVAETEIVSLSSGDRSFATYNIDRHSPMKRSSSSRIRNSLPKIRNIDVPKSCSGNSECPMITDLDEPETRPHIVATFGDSSSVKIATKINYSRRVNSNFHDEIIDAGTIDGKIRQTSNRRLNREASSSRAEFNVQVQPTRDNFRNLDSFELRANSASPEHFLSVASTSKVSATEAIKNQRSSLRSSFFILLSDANSTRECKSPSTSFISTFTLESDEKSGGKDREESSRLKFPAWDADLEVRSGQQDENEPTKSSVSIYVSAFEKLSAKESEKSSTISSLPIFDLKTISPPEKKPPGSEKKVSSSMENKSSTQMTKKSSTISLLPISELKTTSSAEKKSPQSEKKASSSMENKSSPLMRKKSSTVLSLDARVSDLTSEVKKFDCHKILHSRAKKTPSLSNSQVSVGSRPKTLLPPILERSFHSSVTPPCSSANFDRDSSIVPLNLSQKSSAHERIVKSKQRTRLPKSLVVEIIEELNERCVISSQSTYVNFVKKVVKELENNVVGSRQRRNERKIWKNCENRDDEDIAKDYARKNIFIDGKSGAKEQDVKSKNFRASDSSTNSINTDIGSTTFEHHCDNYDRSINVNNNVDKRVTTNNNDDEMENKNYNETTKISTMGLDDEDWLYWNKKNSCNLPRTSSFLSINSRIQSNNAVHTLSPCISPIDDFIDTEKMSFLQCDNFSRNNWGTTYRTSKAHSNGKFSFDETTIMDSGYSDKSSIRSRLSLHADDVIMTKFNCTKSRQIDSCFASFYSELPQDPDPWNAKQTKAQIHRQPFVM